MDRSVEPAISPPNTASTICKGFVEMDGRTLHYIRRGKGPALILLHAAPCSAKVMAPLQAAWEGDFTTFAFDLPGFGLSEMIDVDVLETRHLADRWRGQSGHLDCQRSRSTAGTPAPELQSKWRAGIATFAAWC